MSGASELKDLLKPPFANYDVVVYFGAGLFSLPFLYRYVLKPLKGTPPSFLTIESDKFVFELISSLSALMCVYVLGHIIAYLSSQLVEKALDRFLGKVSTAILISSKTSNASRNRELRKFIGDRVKDVKSDGAMFSALVRALFHVPNVIHYIAIYLIGVFGYFSSRMPKEVLVAVDEKFKRDIVPGHSIATDVKWFKPLEYFVINRFPSAVPRMYNYLVIAGLFRSLSFIFICSSWAVLIFGLKDRLGGTAIPQNQVLPVEHWMLLEWFANSTLSVFCIMSYIKFQRRYAEEAIFAAAYGQ